MLGLARGALASFLIALICAPAAGAAVGDPLGSFVPNRGGDGRGIAVTGTTGYYSTSRSEEVIYKVNLKTRQELGQVDTTLLSSPNAGMSFGALGLDSTGAIWAAEYAASHGWVDRVDPGSGQLQRMFNAAAEDPSLTGVDGLDVDTNGTLWISGEGLGFSSATVYNMTTGGQVISQFNVPFGNSGLAVDGANLWLADIDNQLIHKYDKQGNPAGVSFSVAPVAPEDLALDRCSFPDRLALWAHGAGFGEGPLAAYDIGAADSSGCPKDQPQSGNQDGTKTGGVGTVGSSPVAGRRTWLLVRDARDPGGTLFVYMWRFGDGKRARGRARIAHRYRCAGLYRVRVTVIDTSGARRKLSGRLSVAFPRSATKRYRGLRLSPRVRLAGRRAIVSLRWAGRSRRVRPRAVLWRVDRHRFRPVAPRSSVRSRIARRRSHRLTAAVRFSDGGTRTISTCFYG